MNDTSLLNSVQQYIGADTIQQMSQSIGADSESTSKAVALALPALLGGLSRNAANPQGAASLDQALNAHDGSILDNLGGLLGGGAGGGIGGAILGHILGSKRAPVEEGVGRASGLNAAQVGQILVMLAPIIMGALGRMKKTNGLDASKLPDVLQRDQAQVQSIPGLGGLLDGNGDGNFADDIARMGSAALGGLFGKRS